MEQNPQTEYAIGIDLGTTFSCVGIQMNTGDPVEIIKEESGSFLTPSVVSFRPEGKIFVGTAANK